MAVKIADTYLPNVASVWFKAMIDSGQSIKSGEKCQPETNVSWKTNDDACDLLSVLFANPRMSDFGSLWFAVS